MSKQAVDDYDLEQVYDEQIAPLMAQIIAICKEHQLPMVASFAYRHGENGGSYCSSYLDFAPERYSERLHSAIKTLMRGTSVDKRHENGN